MRWSRLAICVIFARRDEVAATAAEVRTSSSNCTREIVPDGYDVPRVADAGARISEVLDLPAATGMHLAAVQVRLRPGSTVYVRPDGVIQFSTPGSGCVSVQP